MVLSTDKPFALPTTYRKKYYRDTPPPQKAGSAGQRIMILFCPKRPTIPAVNNIVKIELSILYWWENANIVLI